MMCNSAAHVWRPSGEVSQLIHEVQTLLAVEQERLGALEHDVEAIAVPELAVEITLGAGQIGGGIEVVDPEVVVPEA